MSIFPIFNNFINKILSYKILNFQLLNWLLAFSVAIVLFKIISILANSEKKDKKNKE